MKLEIQSLEISDVKLIRSSAFVDRRGEFAETYVRRDFSAAGLTQDFIQDNQFEGQCAPLRHVVSQGLADILFYHEN